MAPDFRSYLTTQLIAEKQTVSYRSVSRALKVHVNSAKCMLYDFWEKENKKYPGSIYATYLVAGTKTQSSEPVTTNGSANHAGEDEPIPSSPPPRFTSSMLQPSQRNEHDGEKESVSVKTISLVREENIESIKKQYSTITSIHIYSLSPGRLGDLVLLTDISRSIYADTFPKEDPLKNNKTYGVIQNPDVRRRKGKRPVISDAAPKFKPTREDKSTKQEAQKSTAASASVKTETDVPRPSSRDSSASASSTKQPSLKRDSSNFFKSYSKAQKYPKLGRQDTDASVSGVEDVKMAGADDEGESEDDAIFLDTGTKKVGTKKRPSDVKQERDDKQAKLRKMMDSDDEAEKAVPNVEDRAGVNEDPPTAKKGREQAETADDVDEDVAWSDSDTEKQGQKASSQDASNINESENMSTEPKRRRGKRQVTKKRTMKDEEGFLVTKEEAVWESFSEDEPEPAKEKPKSAFSSMKSQPSSQKSSAAAKDGTQKKKGDIMRFFGKN